MKSILIGATGFVGGNLSQQIKFDVLASSKNISEFKGHFFDLVVIAAGDARKWYANANPKEDLHHISKLSDDICSINAKRVIHFSTIDVYKTKLGNELSLPDEITTETYGSNRYYLEEVIRRRFKNSSTIRLPALYGNGLKKNLIFDVLNNRELSSCNPESSFQWFDLNNLNNIIKFVEDNKIPLLNVCSEPLNVLELLLSLDIPTTDLSPAATLVKYDVTTIYGALFGKSGSYLYSKKQCVSGVKNFLNEACFIRQDS